ncbi:MAG: hypothetical protein NVSMB25_02120 [Thermoleophilaceae bacterium]
MGSRPRTALALAIAACAWTAAFAGPALAQCQAGAPAEASCETITVPLDRSGALAGTVPLYVERRATAHPGASPGAMLVLAGGPGQAATPFTTSFKRVLGPALDTRNLVVFDQRGTGRSGRIDCPAIGVARSVPVLDRATEACAHSLGPARGLYTSRDSADDIEAIRRAIGVDRIALYGVSYGTYTAMAYARRYPAHVELLVLDSVLDPGGRDPFDRTTYAAIPRVLRAVCGGRCRKITRDPATDLSILVRGLLRRPLRATAYRSNGRRLTGRITAAEVLRIVEGADLDPILRSQLPSALHSALKGDTAPLGRLLLRGQGSHGGHAPVGADSDALFLATSCEEEPLPWSRTGALSDRPSQDLAAISRLPASLFSPWDRATELALGSARPCLRWPNALPTSPALSGPLPDVPALILAGEQDTRTPLADARSAAALLPRAQLVSVPGTGHSVLGSDLGSCSQTALRQFFGGQPVLPCASGSSSVPPAPLAPLRLAALRGQRGLPGSAGRTLTAVRATLSDSTLLALDDALFGQPIAAGGLRGGTLRGDIAGGLLRVTLSRVVFVPGVGVSGRLRIDVSGRTPAFAHVTVSGGVKGSLTFARGSISGRLGSRRVRVGVRLAAAAAGGILPLRAPGELRRLR